MSLIKPVTIPSMRPEPERDRWGRYLLQAPDGSGKRAWTRGTTVAHTLSDQHGISLWKQRKVLEGAAIRPDLLAGVTALAREAEDAPDWRAAKEAKQELDRTAEAAADAAGANNGSKLGTLLHTITEYADAGRLGEIAHLVPDELVDDLAAYLAKMSDADIERPAEWIERILVNTRVEAGGTTDRILVMPAPCRKCGKTLRIGDVKSQKSVDFGWLEIAIQLAIYANADVLVDLETGELEAMPDVCKCFGIVMHVPVGTGTCELYEIDLEAGWNYATLAFDVRAARGQAKAIGWKYAYTSTTAAKVRAAGEAARGGDVMSRTRLANGGRGAVDEPMGKFAAAAKAEAELDPVVPEVVEHDPRVAYLVQSAPHIESLKALWRDLEGRGLWTDELTELYKTRRAELAAEPGV